MRQTKRSTEESPWNLRRWRIASGLMAVSAVLLSAVLLVMVNRFFYRLGPRRWKLGGDRAYTLSEKTRSLLAGLDREVRGVAFFDPANEYFSYVRALLREYAYECAARGQGRLRIEMVDPNRDLVRTRALQQTYQVSEPNVVVFECEGRRKYCELRDIVDRQLQAENVDLQTLVRRKTLGTVRKVVRYLGEQAFSSAILSVTQARRPTVYFLSGHGEREIDDFSKPTGLSRLARALERDNMLVRKFRMADFGGIPDDCSLLVIAGPTRKLPRAEIDRIASYLDRNGRVLIFLAAGVLTGLEPLLATWGVQLERDVVLDPAATLTGQEIFVKQYGFHPITRRLRNLDLTLYLPRSVEPVPGFEGTAQPSETDKARVSPLIFTTDRGWSERDVEQDPPKWDPPTDRRGPISLAVAVEKGPPSGLNVEIKPTRLVVVGNVEFVSNSALEGGGSGNTDFVLSAANWLVEREALMAIGPRSPETLVPGMDRTRQRWAFFFVVFAGPLMAGLAGVIVAWRRQN